MMTIKEALRDGIQCLKSSTTPTPELDARLLLMHVLGMSSTALYAYPETIVTPEQACQFQTLLNRRSQGEPIAYLIGEREFWSLPLQVNQHTLIPRPETELLVELALRDERESINVLDLGTGSGAIALALASSKPHWQVYASDQSNEALAVAKKNADTLGLKNIHFSISNWFHPAPSIPFDLIVSNPPYLSSTDPHLTQGDLRFEPKSALVSGERGLTDLALIIYESPLHLSAKGQLFVEHGYDQGPAVYELFKERGYQHIHTYNDLNNLPRVTTGVAH